jgi:hypothetical protein
LPIYRFVVARMSEKFLRTENKRTVYPSHQTLDLSTLAGNRDRTSL